MFPILVSVVTYVALIVLAPVVLWKSATRLMDLDELSQSVRQPEVQGRSSTPNLVREN
jgi:hypothetical protein